MRAARTAMRGFSLIELLVALAIAAMVIATAVSAVSGALAATSRSQGYADAVVIARGRLAQAELEPAEGETAGDEQVAGRRYDWRLTMAPYETEPEDAERRAVLTLLAATIEVEWGDGRSRRSLSATTLFLAAPGRLQ